MSAGRLKDMFFTKEFVQALGARLQQAYPAFDHQTFTNRVLTDAWPETALKEKMHHISTSLRAGLPSSYSQALAILLEVAPDFRGFDAMIFPDFVECYGLGHWEESMAALEVFTLNASAEFAVRAFLVLDQERALARMSRWAESEDARLRRLASEGCRPRLPWAIDLPAFKANPAPILPILERLKADPSEDVRRSIANNLNDIAKDHPDLVLDICERWQGQSEETDRLIKHACRGMLKKGNTRAMRLFGFASPDALGLENMRLNRNTADIGDKVQMDFDLVVDDEEPVQVRLEYAVYFIKSSGMLSSKVFKIREGAFGPGRHSMSKKHSFADQSTRKHYPGRHWIAVIVNGVEKARQPLELEAPVEVHPQRR